MRLVSSIVLLLIFFSCALVNAENIQLGDIENDKYNILEVFPEENEASTERNSESKTATERVLKIVVEHDRYEILKLFQNNKFLKKISNKVIKKMDLPKKR